MQPTQSTSDTSCCRHFTGNFWALHQITLTSHCWTIISLGRGSNVGGRQFHSNEEVQVAACEWLEMQEPSVVWIVLKNNYT
jgi:hypothetical protein